MATATPLLTTRQLQAGFGVSDMTIWAWRNGTPTRSVLPTVKEGRAVLFKPADIAAWAKKHELPFDLAKATSTENVKLGPKTSTKAADKPAAKKVAVAKKAAPAKKAVAAKKAAAPSKPVKASKAKVAAQPSA